ncbi:Rz1-like lysis system protein LysC [Gallaecimonas kandeliae]|uniref:Rz1-like lysis system protein LysC n=1 Tax=Gallaecimonas kandeliae TaxID=3029055 RepID=UPI003AF32362
MLASCASSSPPAPVLPKPQPAALMVPCPPPVSPEDNGMDATALALKQLYDQYGLCAGRLYELQRRLLGERNGH